MAAFFSHSPRNIVRGIIFPALILLGGSALSTEDQHFQIAPEFCSAPVLAMFGAQLELTDLIHQKHQLHTSPTESLGAEGYQHS